MYVVIVDSTQIQPYIFGSNRLKENIGASYLVSRATGEWALASLPQPNNVDDAAAGLIHKGKELAKDSLAAEALYAGGGNVVTLLRDQEGVEAFVRNLSCKALTEAPGLQLVISSRERQTGESLAEAIQQSFQKLAQEKQVRSVSAPLLGLGVTMMCGSTALPAVGIATRIADDPTSEYPAAAEILAKLGVNGVANGRLRHYLPPPSGYDYPRDFDDLGREEGEESHIAIVHADGNGMGQRFLALVQTHLHENNDRKYIQAIRDLSEQVKEASKAALQATLAALLARIHADEPNKRDAIRLRNAAGEMIAEVILPKKEGTFYLPFRPLVFGGDDVTFVCDGRLGISLAVTFLRQFEKATERILKEKLTACAGIAIVKSHYPFARAYGLAEQLCSSAKRYRKQKGLEDSCLDWHFALTGLSGDIQTIRQREYTVYQDPAKLMEEGTPPYRGERLTLRPLTLGPNLQESHRAFPVTQAGVMAFQDLYLAEDQQPQWSTRRNKVKALRQALRDGPAAVRRFLTMYDLERGQLPPIDSSKDSDFQASGWWHQWCGYFDAIEMMDWYIPLEGNGQ